MQGPAHSIFFRYRDYAAPVSVFLVAFVLRCLFVESNSIALDEPFSIYHAQMGIPEIIARLKTGNNPPLYEILLHGWIRVFGISPLSVRFPSLLFGAATASFVYLLGKEFLNRRTALLATVLVTFSTYQVYFSHEARVYALFSLLATVSFYLFLKWARRPGHKTYIILLFFTDLAMVYAHYFAFFVILLQCVSVALRVRTDRRLLPQYLAMLGLLVLAYVPNIYVVWLRFRDASAHKTWVPPVENLGHLHDLIFYFSNRHRAVYVVFLVLLWAAAHKLARRNLPGSYAGLVAAGAVVPLLFFTGISVFVPLPLMWKITSQPVYTAFFLVASGAFLVGVNRVSRPDTALIVNWFLGPLLLMFALSFRIPVFLDRYLVFVSPAFYLTVAAAADYLIKPRTAFGFISGGICVLMAGTVNPNPGNHRQVKELVRQAEALDTPNTLVVLCPKDFELSLAYHYAPEIFKRPGRLTERLREARVLSVYHADEVHTDGYPHVLYIDAGSGFSAPHKGIYEKLTAGYGLRNRYVYADSLILYDFAAPEPVPGRP